MKTERERLIAKEVARVAQNATPYLLEERVILTTINLALQPKATKTEFESILEEMESAALIKRVNLDTPKIKLTDEGIAELLA